MGAYRDMELYLVRHGLTRWNRERRYLGHTDQPLLEEGRSALEPLGRELRRIPFAAVWCSDLLRCRETVSMLLPASRPCPDARLRELDFGEWEGADYEQLKDRPAYREWLERWMEKRPPGGETGEEFEARVMSCWRDIAATAAAKSSRESVMSCWRDIAATTTAAGHRDQPNSGLSGSAAGTLQAGGGGLSGYVQDRTTRTKKACPADDDLQTTAGPVLIVTHGGVIRLLVSRLMPGTAYWDVRADIGRGYRLQLRQLKEGGEWTCCSLSEAPMQAKENQR